MPNKEDPYKLILKIDKISDELGDILCDKNAKLFGTIQNLSAKRLSRELYNLVSKLRFLLDPN